MGLIVWGLGGFGRKPVWVAAVGDWAQQFSVPADPAGTVAAAVELGRVHAWHHSGSMADSVAGFTG